MKNPTVAEALQNALDLLESLGYKSGDIHDDLELAISRIMRLPVAKQEL